MLSATVIAGATTKQAAGGKHKKQQTAELSQALAKLAAQLNEVSQSDAGTPGAFEAVAMKVQQRSHSQPQ